MWATFFVKQKTEFFDFMRKIVKIRVMSAISH